MTLVYFHYFSTVLLFLHNQSLPDIYSSNSRDKNK
jgi:hypothetical protein